MTAQAVGHETRGLHLLDEGTEPGLGSLAPLGHGHGLLDHHEAAGQQAQGRRPGGCQPGHVGLQLLPHAGRHLLTLGHELIDHGG